MVVNCKQCKNGKDLPSANIDNGKRFGAKKTWIAYQYCPECGRENRYEKLWEKVVEMERELFLDI